MKNLIIILSFILISQLSATIINIPVDQPTIQTGIDSAVDADTVLVQPGTYFENLNYNGKNMTIASLFLITQDTTYISQTIIDGDSLDSVVTFENQEDSTAILCGFTITNGYGFNDDIGGGISCINSSPKLEYLYLTNNNSVSNGGGIFCYDNSNPSLSNLNISQNYAYNYGGGIYCRDSNVSINNSVLTQNVSHRGGGLSATSSTINLTNSYFSYNQTDGSGGGIYINHCTDSILENLIVDNNISEYSGGGITSTFSNLTIRNIILSNNTAVRGGGVAFWSSSEPVLEFALIINNNANYGGGIFSQTSGVNITNVTAYNNLSTNGGGTLYSKHYSGPVVTNCIFWNNYPQEIMIRPGNYPSNEGTITISYSDIQGGLEGVSALDPNNIFWLEGNINIDPIFQNPNINDFHLQSNSPCIDAGDPNHPFDPDNTIADMGAFYYDQLVSIQEDIIQFSILNKLSNYPNPFNPSTTIEFSIQNDSQIELSIFNIKGQKIKTLTQNEFLKGTHSIIWNGDDEEGQAVSSGVYLYQLNINDKIEAVKKCLLLK